MLEIKLYEPQKYALMCEAKEVLYGGAAGGGKSYLFRVASTIFATEVPGINIYLFRRTYKELMLNHVYATNGFLVMFKEMMDAGDVEFNKSEGCFHWWNGSRIFLCHAQHETDVTIYQGAEFHVLMIDEASQFTEYMIRYLRSRVRLGSLEVPPKWATVLPKALYGSNPGGISHIYLKSNFVDHGSRRIVQAPKDDGGMKRVYVPAKWSDNIVMMRIDPEYPDRLRGLGDARLVDAYLNGSWDGLVDGPFAGLWDGKTHVIEPFDIPAEWSIDRSHDHGTSAPAATVYVAECDGSEVELPNGTVFGPPRGSLIVIAELYFANRERKGLELPPLELGSRMVKFEKDEGLEDRVDAGPADNSIFTAAPGFASIYSFYLKSGIHFHRSDKAPGSRARGVTIFQQLLRSTLQGATDAPHIYFFSTCHHCVRTIPNLPRDEKNPDDVDSNSEDHLWDAVRYRTLKSFKKAVQRQFGGY